jgi:hypothetical protein
MGRGRGRVPRVSTRPLRRGVGRRRRRSFIIITKKVLSIKDGASPVIGKERLRFELFSRSWRYIAKIPDDALVTGIVRELADCIAIRTDRKCHATLATLISRKTSTYSSYSTTGWIRTVRRYRAFEFAFPTNSPDTFLITEAIVSVASVTPMKITQGWLMFRAWNARRLRGLREGPLVRRGSRRRTWLGRGIWRRGGRDAGALRDILLLLVSLSSVALLGLGPFTTASTVEARNGCMLIS